MGGSHGNQSHQQRDACGRYAALEDREEPDDVCRTGDAAFAFRGRHSMSKFVRAKLTIEGVETVVHIAGTGDPVVVFHGAGTVDGFDFAENWADKFRVIVPYHPG